MEESRTVKEVLEDVVKMLSDIKVPMSEIDSIGLPVARSINAIKACLDALIINENQEPPKQEEPEEPDIEIVTE